MDDRDDRDRIIRMAKTIDSLRQQLHQHVCKLSTILAAAEIGCVEDILRDINDATGVFNSALTNVRYKLIQRFLMFSPHEQLTQLETDNTIIRLT